MLSEWARKQWLRRGSPRFTKLHYYGNLTILLFSVLWHSLVGGITLCRDAVGVFYSSSRLGYRILIGGVLPFCRNAVGVFYSPSCLSNRKLGGRGLHRCSDAVVVFYSPSRLDHGAHCGRSLTLLQRCNRWILQPQPTRSQSKMWEESYSF